DASPREQIVPSAVVQISQVTDEPDATSARVLEGSRDDHLDEHTPFDRPLRHPVAALDAGYDHSCRGATTAPGFNSKRKPKVAVPSVLGSCVRGVHARRRG